jgi:hypothetical protein
VTFEKDELRIEEERAGVARPAPRTLASSHLLQALDALDDACSPDALYRPRRTWPLRRDDSAAAWATRAEVTQRNLCCTATLFTAFAAEAYVNDFLDIHLRAEVSAKKFAEVDKHWSTRRKYVEAVPLAYAPLFRDSEDDEVIPYLTSLFRVRNALVHARPGSGPPMAAMPDPSWRTEYPPTTVAQWLVAVAGAADALEVRCYGFDYFSFPGRTIWHGRKAVMARAEGAEPLPRPDDKELPPLIEALNDGVRRQNEAHRDLRLTVDELREARLRLAEQLGAWDTFTDLVVRQQSRSPKPPND